MNRLGGCSTSRLFASGLPTLIADRVFSYRQGLIFEASSVPVVVPAGTHPLIWFSGAATHSGKGIPTRSAYFCDDGQESHIRRNHTSPAGSPSAVSQGRNVAAATHRRNCKGASGRETGGGGMPGMKNMLFTKNRHTSFITAFRCRPPLHRIQILPTRLGLVQRRSSTRAIRFSHCPRLPIARQTHLLSAFKNPQ